MEKGKYEEKKISFMLQELKRFHQKKKNKRGNLKIKTTITWRFKMVERI